MFDKNGISIQNLCKFLKNYYEKNKNWPTFTGGGDVFNDVGVEFGV